jgi:thioredoxin reductase (NADPH)
MSGNAVIVMLRLLPLAAALLGSPILAEDNPPTPPPLFAQQEDLHGVDDGFGLSLCLDIEAPIADKLMENDDCAGGSGCQPALDEVQKLVILGSGPAGLSAAIYAARANLDPVVVSIDGGQLEGTSEVENYPGAAPPPPDGCGDDAGARPLHGVSGQAIVETFNQQARAFGTRFVEGWVDSISLPEPPFELRMSGGTTLRANALIIASGATTKWLGLPSETKYRGSGVSSCATCDGFFFKNQRVAVIGGGDSAMEEALFLARICSSVKLIHRRASFSATPLLVDQVLENPKIEVIWDSVVEEFYSHNSDLLSHVIVKNVKTEQQRDLVRQATRRHRLWSGALADMHMHTTACPGHASRAYPGQQPTADDIARAYNLPPAACLVVC